MAGIEPAASTLARRDRSLAVTPAGRLPRSRFGLPLWCSRYGGVKNQACARGSQGRQEAHPQVNENRPEGLSLGRLPARASWRLHGNHSAHQGSLKLRDRVHVPGSFRRLQCRHTSMVGRPPAASNWIYRRMVNPGCGRHQDAARTPTARRPAAGGRLRRRWWMRQPAPKSVHVAATTPCRQARTGLPPGARAKHCNRPLPGKGRTIQHATGTGISRATPGNLWMVCA